MSSFRFLPIFALSALGCGASDVVDAGTADAGSDARDATAVDAGKDAGPVDAGLNGCAEADFVDQSAPNDPRMITWTFNVTPRCLAIAKGQSVMWMGSLATHPLAANGGDIPSPIVGSSTGTSVTYAFAAPGDYGFVCTNHQPMTGVVRVR